MERRVALSIDQCSKSKVDAIRSVRSNGSRKKCLISYSYVLTRVDLYNGNVPLTSACSVPRVAKGISDPLLADTIGESIGEIQRRRATHPFRCRRKANDVLGRGQAHGPIHVYGSRSICRDHQWKPPGFNPDGETPSCQ